MGYHRPALVRPVDDDELRGRGGAVVDASLLETLIALLDGARGTEEIIGELVAEGFEVEEVLAAIRSLDERGLIAESPASPLSELSEAEKERYGSQIQALARFSGGAHSGLSPWPVAGAEGQVRLKKSLAVVAGDGVVAPQVLTLLARAGVGKLGLLLETGSPSEPARGLSDEIRSWNPSCHFREVARLEDLRGDHAEPHLLIYCPRAFDEAECERLNALSLAQGLPLLIYRTTVTAVELGPLVLPRESACYICYRRRRAGAQTGQEDRAGFANAGLAFPIGAEFVALEAVKFLSSTAEPVTRGRLWAADLLSGLLDVHPVLKLPRCPACGVKRTRRMRRLWEA